LVAVAIERGDIVGVGWCEDLLEAVVVQIGDGHVLIVHAPAIARLAVMSGRPAWAHAAIRLVHVDLLGIAGAGSSDNDLEFAVLLEILDCQGAHFAAAEGMARPDLATGAVVDSNLVTAAADNDLRRAVAGQIGHRDARPGAVAV